MLNVLLACQDSMTWPQVVALLGGIAGAVAVAWILFR